jgi:RES domain-containing protein
VSLPPPAALDFAIRAATLTPLPSDLFYRSVDLVVAANLGIHVLDGSHAGRTGGRYNSPLSPPTNYLAGTQTLAAFECEQRALILNHPAPRSPRVSFAVTVLGAQVLDLTSALVLAGFGLSQAHLTQPASHWQFTNSTGAKAPTQVLGDAARVRADCDGVLAPSWLCSLLPAGTLRQPNNLVLFMDPNHPTRHRNSAVSMTIYDPTGLLP